MMALQLKNDTEVKIARQQSQEALDDNHRALRELLECVYGVGGVARDRIAKLINDRTGGDGKDDPSGVQ